MYREDGPRGGIGATLFCLGMLAGVFGALAGDNAQLISVSVQPGTVVMPRTMFTQTWTFQNTGTNTWTPTHTGCTLNLIGKDSLAAVPLSPNSFFVVHSDGGY